MHVQQSLVGVPVIAVCSTTTWVGKLILSVNILSGRKGEGLSFQQSTSMVYYEGENNTTTTFLVIFLNSLKSGCRGGTQNQE